MEVLRVKGANKPVSHRVKIPADLSRRLADLGDRVQALNYEVDWDAPAVKALSDLADAVERDLAKQESGAQPDGSALAVAKEDQTPAEA